MGKVSFEDDLFPTDEELDELLDALEAEDEAAAGVLHEALGDLFDEPPPKEALAAAVGTLREGIATSHWPYRYFAGAARATVASAGGSRSLRPPDHARPLGVAPSARRSLALAGEGRHVGRGRT